MKADSYEDDDSQGPTVSYLRRMARPGDVTIIDIDDSRRLATILVHGKERNVAVRSLCCLSVTSYVRRGILVFIESKYSDWFILGCIGVNSILLALEKHRAPATDPTNVAVEIISNVLSAIFLAECVLKVCGWGFLVYLKDPWNVLDFVVVVSAVVEWIPWIPFGGLGFLRLFRVLRPLRSLNSVPEMKLLVNTTVGAIPRLVNVATLGVFIFTVFGIVGITLMTGIFYRECHTTPNPTLISSGDTYCWEWPKLGDGKLCGGAYDCTGLEDRQVVRYGYCGGHELETGGYAPVFESNLTSLGPESGGPFQWCSDDSKPAKVAPELDFVHFDHLAGAFLLIFQCMTMEGWTDIMYYVKDAFSTWFAVVYFFALIIIASHFLLNVALAVVDEVRDDFDGDSDAEEEEESKDGNADDKTFSMESEWSESGCVRLCSWLTQTPPWQNFIMLIITANVVSMCLQQFPPNVILQESLQIMGYVFLVVFIVEMVVEVISRGLCGYIRNPTTCFDGIVVIISVVETCIQIGSGGGSGSALQALRTLRLFRVLNKFASRNPKIAILLKAMIGTAKALRYWLVLFVLVLYICTLMWMHFFANTLQFEDPDGITGWSGRYDGDENSPKLRPWCELELDTPLARQRTSWHFKQDCIPRAHFDNFGWGFVTIFQIMTGENWNAVMYAGMRATREQNWEWAFGILYVLLLLFGQTLFLSLFLSMLLAKFDEFRDKLSEQDSANRLRTTLAMQVGDDGADGPLFGDKKAAKLAREVASYSVAHSGLQAVIMLRTSAQKTSDTDVALAEAAVRERRRRARVQLKKANQEWPYGWSWFMFPENFFMRKWAQAVLSKTVSFHNYSINVFDTFILLCILFSTLCMMIDYPLADPSNPLIMSVRLLDTVFAIIFILEMVVKFMAWPLFWGDNAYLWSPGCSWNWLDFVVVLVSILGFSGGGPSELKILRILRAFRPLRVVKRMETLKNIVSAIFNSMKELGVLLVVFLLFLLIFALVFMMYLNGTLYACSESNVWFHRDVKDTDFNSFTLPLCINNDSLQSVSVTGAFNESSGAWSAGGDCADAAGPNGTGLAWQRATPDTPICVGRCDPFWRVPFNTTYAAPPSICPRKYDSTEELPHRCHENGVDPTRKFADDEVVGFEYIEKMQARYVLPCGGATPASVVDGAEPPAGHISCRSTFCPVVDPALVETCRRAAEIHPFFCAQACNNGKKSTAECRTCRAEFRAACECPDFCKPLIRDAALCVEQGGTWDQVLSHNFDNVFNSMLLLIEISTTEGWVDAMYAACDTNWLPYVQPVRDASHPVWMALFILWILFSFMFLMNLGVGIIVDKFMEMRQMGKDIISPMQLRWIKSRLSLQKRGSIFTLMDLHLLSPVRRKVYHFTEHPFFERTIMTCIVLNTLLMGVVSFPELDSPTMWAWRYSQEILNYFFAAVFTIEAIFKIYALRSAYFKDAWNLFDFVCVVATLAGIGLSVAESGINVSSVASVVRIFRIARLFRLLKFKALRNLKKLFQSLAISVVKLANVGVVAFLFLVLFSILGVSLFSAVSTESDTHDEHGNFKHFANAFITLFRASTGEAWNEIMHDLHKDEGDWFNAGSWCTPAFLFDTDSKYEVLKDKCLIDHPNACVVTLFGDWNALPWLFWVGYTWFIGLVIMNVVIAVILDGYEETKSSDEGSIIDTCKWLWGKKFDPDHRMSIPFTDAIKFIVEAIRVLQKEGVIGGERVNVNLPDSTDSLSGFGIDFSKFPLKFARALDLKPTPRVEFHVAVRQVLRFATIVESNSQVDAIQELDQCDEKDDRKDIQRLRALEARDEALQAEGEAMALHIAAIRVQRVVRAAIKKLQRRRKGKGPRRDADGKEIAPTAQGREDFLRRTAAAEALAASQPGGALPPQAG